MKIGRGAAIFAKIKVFETFFLNLIFSIIFEFFFLFWLVGHSLYVYKKEIESDTENEKSMGNRVKGGGGVKDIHNGRELPQCGKP